ncbi:hypothetical protein ACQJBY_023531 [Aegilops geniculata]
MGAHQHLQHSSQLRSRRLHPRLVHPGNHLPVYYPSPMLDSSTDPSCALCTAVLLHSAVHRADGRGGSQGNRPLHRDSVLRPITGGRGGAGAAAPMPPSLGPPCPRLPRARGHRPLPLHVRRRRLDLPRRRPRIHLRQDLLHRRLLLHRGVRPPQLPGPPGR